MLLCCAAVRKKVVVFVLFGISLGNGKWLLCPPSPTPHTHTHAPRTPMILYGVQRTPSVSPLESVASYPLPCFMLTCVDSDDS